MIRHWHSLTQEVKCLRFVSLGVFENRIRQTLVGVIPEHFSHCAKVQPKRMSSIQGAWSWRAQLFVVTGSHSLWNCGAGWTTDDIDHVYVPCE